MQLRQENRTKDIIQIEKEEIKLSLFAGDMIVYVEKPKESTKKQSLELLSNYNNPCYNCRIYNKYTKVNCFQGGAHMYTCGGFILIFGKTNYVKFKNKKKLKKKSIAFL